MLNIIDVALTNECNYSCSYCIAKAYKSINERTCPKNKLATVKSGSQIHPDILINWIKNHFSKDDTIISFAGGEPLLYPPIKHCIMSLIEYRKVIVSNMAVFSYWHSRVMPRLFDYNLKMKMSFHPTMTTWDKFKEHVKNVPKDKGLINYVLYPQHLITGIYKEYIENIKSSGYKWNVNAFKGEYDGKWWDKNSEEIKGLITWDTEYRPFRIFGVEPNGNVNQCYKHILGNIYSHLDINIKPDVPKCVFDCGEKEKEMSFCDCFNAIAKLWDIN